MSKNKGKILLAVALIVISFILHAIHYFIFREMHHMLLFLVEDIAFIPLEVLFVTLVFERIIELQSKRESMRKMNMLIELFYLEMGYPLLSKMAVADEYVLENQEFFKIDMNSTKEDYIKLGKLLSSNVQSITMSSINLSELHMLLKEKKDVLIQLITNPALVEHESFSDTLMATFHLLDELDSRDLDNLPEEDIIHLKFDIERAYNALTTEWIPYMKNLKEEYPYLFFTAIQKNPFIITK